MRLLIGTAADEAKDCALLRMYRFPLLRKLLSQKRKEINRYDEWCGVLDYASAFAFRHRVKDPRVID